MSNPVPTEHRSAAQSLEAWLRQAFFAAFPEAPPSLAPGLVPATDPEFGDFQCNDAMSLAKSLRMAPRAIALRIVEALPPENAPATATIAGPGFINFKVSPDWLARQVAAVAGHIPSIGGGSRVILDYSSPNVAK